MQKTDTRWTALASLVQAASSVICTTVEMRSSEKDPCLQERIAVLECRFEQIEERLRKMEEK